MTQKEARAELGLPARSRPTQDAIQAAYAKRLNEANSRVVLAVSVSARNQANAHLHRIHEAKRTCLADKGRPRRTEGKTSRPCRSRTPSRSRLRKAFADIRDICSAVFRAIKTVLSWTRAVILATRDAADELAGMGIPKFVTITAVVVVILAFLNGCAQTINKIIGG